MKLLQYTEPMEKYNEKSYVDQAATILENRTPKHQKVSYCQW